MSQDDRDGVDLPAFLDGLFDRGLGVLDRFVDLEFATEELKVQRDLQLFREAQAQDVTNRQAALGAGTGEIFGSGGIDAKTVLLIGAVAVGAAIIFGLSR